MGWSDRFRKEVIGNPECPVMHRWTLVGNTGENLESPSRCKLILHHFLPNGDDPDPHDHPRSFLTIILKGGYQDRVPCPSPHEPWPKNCCALCSNNKGMVVGDVMTPGKIRFRRAEHTHITSISPMGCWSLVLMGPLVRRWGFTWDGEWWPWKKYLAERGEEATRCP